MQEVVLSPVFLTLPVIRRQYPSILPNDFPFLPKTEVPRLCFTLESPRYLQNVAPNPKHSDLIDNGVQVPPQINQMNDKVWDPLVCRPNLANHTIMKVHFKFAIQFWIGGR